MRYIQIITPMVTSIIVGMATITYIRHK